VIVLAHFLTATGNRVDPINPENARKIVRGMTRFDVERILDGPAGDYSEGRVDLAKSQVAQVDELMLKDIGRGDAFWSKGDIWIGSECAIKVEFDSRDSVQAAAFVVHSQRAESTLSRFWRFLGNSLNRR
jgi:hypothetical protein